MQDSIISSGIPGSTGVPNITKSSTEKPQQQPFSIVDKLINCPFAKNLELSAIAKEIFRARETRFQANKELKENSPRAGVAEVKKVSFSTPLDEIETFEKIIDAAQPILGPIYSEAKTLVCNLANIQTEIEQTENKNKPNLKRERTKLESRLKEVFADPESQVKIAADKVAYLKRFASHAQGPSKWGILWRKAVDAILSKIPQLSNKATFAATYIDTKNRQKKEYIEVQTWTTHLIGVARLNIVQDDLDVITTKKRIDEIKKIIPLQIEPMNTKAIMNGLGCNKDDANFILNIPISLIPNIIAEANSEKIINEGKKLLENKIKYQIQLSQNTTTDDESQYLKDINRGNTIMRKDQEFNIIDTKPLPPITSVNKLRDSSIAIAELIKPGDEHWTALIQSVSSQNTTSSCFEFVKTNMYFQFQDMINEKKIAYNTRLKLNTQDDISYSVQLTTSNKDLPPVEIEIIRDPVTKKISYINVSSEVGLNFDIEYEINQIIINTVTIYPLIAETKINYSVIFKDDEFKIIDFKPTARSKILDLI